MMNWAGTRDCARSCASVASAMCWACPAPPQYATCDLEAPLPEYAGHGRRPKAPWQAVTEWRTSLDPTVWTRLTVRDGEKGPVHIEMIKRWVQTRMERKRLGPEEWLVVTRRPLADERTWEPRASRDATEQDTRHRYQYYLTPTEGCGVVFKEP